MPTGSVLNIPIKIWLSERRKVVDWLFPKPVVTNLVEYRNCRSVWKIPNTGFAGAHFATYPEALPERCIMASSRPGDIVLDIFAGSGTTNAVAAKLGRKSIAIELNVDYIDFIVQRVSDSQVPLFP